MYTIKNWETIKGKKVGETPTILDIDKIIINIEKIISINLSSIQNDIVANNDKICTGKQIYN